MTQTTLSKLINITKEHQLIKDISDITFLIPNFDEKTIENEDLDTQINKALEWAFENNKLKDFYNEHLETFIELDYATEINDCSISSSSSISTYTDFQLYQFETKDYYLFKVIGSGDSHEMWDTHGWFDERSISDPIDEVISNFKMMCNDVYTCNDDFSSDELDEDGNSIDFHDYRESSD